MLILVPTAGEAQSLFDDAAPSSETVVDTSVDGVRVRAALCGFGPVAAGTLAAVALGAERPDACLHVGIAGTFRPDELPVGGLLEPAEVRLTGVGRGRGAKFQGPHDLSFAQAPDGPGGDAVYDVIALGGPDSHGVLLTVAAASATAEEAAGRLRRHPEARGEDMESFAVALACRRLGVPLRVLRGISNVAGEPDRGRWEVDRALAAVRERLAHLLSA